MAENKDVSWGMSDGRKPRCVLSSKPCRINDRKCPRYRRSDYYKSREPERVHLDRECRYRGLTRWDREMVKRDFVDGGVPNAKSETF